MLELSGVSKSYKKQTILFDINHSFDTGVTVMTGKSGAGKSTLLRLCASAEKPSSGGIAWNGNSIVKTPRPFRKILGYAPQQIDFPGDISALDFMRHVGALKGMSYKEASAQGLSILSRLELGVDADKRISMYSGGMRRRLGLAQAFLGAPQCLILDEPTAELDPETAKLVHDFIFELGQKAVVIMTTHLQGSMQDYDYSSFHIESLTS